MFRVSFAAVLILMTLANRPATAQDHKNQNTKPAVTAAGSAAEARALAAETAPLVVHEWGVFTVRPDADSANADLAAEWAGLPKFVYGQIRGRGLPTRRVMTAVRKPVVYLHSERELAFELSVRFAKGLPAVWWPATSKPGVMNSVVGKGLAVVQSLPGDVPTPATQATDTLVWDLRLQPGVDVDSTKAHKPEVPAGHWFEKLRGVQANWVYALPAGKSELERIHPLSICEVDRFVYYDGVMPVGKWVAITVTNDRVGLANTAEHDFLDVTVVDRRASDRVRVGRVERLPAGRTIENVELTMVEAKTWPKSAATRLVEQLTAAGLNRDEAESLLAIWEKDFFAGAGVTVWYRLPQAEYEKLLPMSIKPAEVENLRQRVRVGLILHPELGLAADVTLAEQVARLLRELDHDEFAVRETATAELHKLGRGAVPLLRSALARELSPEAKLRINAVLDRLDARVVFPPRTDGM